MLASQSSHHSTCTLAVNSNTVCTRKRVHKHAHRSPNVVSSARTWTVCSTESRLFSYGITHPTQLVCELSSSFTKCKSQRFARRLASMDITKKYYNARYIKNSYQNDDNNHHRCCLHAVCCYKTTCTKRLHHTSTFSLVYVHWMCTSHSKYSNKSVVLYT